MPTGSPPSFERELEIFGRECDAVVQFLFAQLAINAVAARNQRVLKALNRTPLFWRTVAGALQASAFVAVGRIFDTRSRHNIYALMRSAEQSRTLFDKDALAARKRKGSDNADEWLPEYMSRVRVPTNTDFRRMRKMVAKYRKLYESQADRIRDKYFAHREVADEQDVQALFQTARTSDLQRLAVFCVQVHDAFWQLFHNGRRLALRPMAYSVSGLVGRRLSRWSTRIQEAIVQETKDCLRDLAGRSAVGSRRSELERYGIRLVRKPRR